MVPGSIPGGQTCVAQLLARFCVAVPRQLRQYGSRCPPGFAMFARLLPDSTPAIAQLAEHLTVDTCSNQMVPGSIPGGRILTLRCLKEVRRQTEKELCMQRQKMRMPGVEPRSQAWEACMMPLHYMRFLHSAILQCYTQQCAAREPVHIRREWQP